MTEDFGIFEEWYPSYKNYLDEMKGTPMQDVWSDVHPLMGNSQERLGYPTQKP